MEISLEPIIKSLNAHLPLFISVIAIIAGADIAFILSNTISKALYRAFFDSEKKSYDDEMKVYDDKQVKKIQSLPEQSGQSLSDLIDGELPESAFRSKS